MTTKPDQRPASVFRCSLHTPLLAARLERYAVRCRR